MCNLNTALSLLCLFVLTDRPQGYEEINITDGASISGSVRIQGKLPEDSLIKVGTHSDYCGEWVSSGRLQLGQDQGVKWAVVMIGRIEKGKKFAPVQPLLIHNEDCRFEPRVAVIADHTPFNIKNRDGIPHRAAFGLIDDASIGKDIMAVAVPWTEIELDTRRIVGHNGLISIKGIIHPFERGWIWKLPHPYAAVTDISGAFKIDQVPPGTYQLRIWHEFLGEQTVSVTLRAGEEKQLEVVYDAAGATVRFPEIP